MPTTCQQDELVTSVLEIDLGAIAHNYRAYTAQVSDSTRVAAAVKANAYGLGMEQVSTTLANAGCTDFFVANLEEGVALRQVLADAHIYVLNGILPGQEHAFGAFRLSPVLNSFEQARLWRDYAEGRDALPAPHLHVDTGMNRLGCPVSEVEKVMALRGLTLGGVMSHLACASTPDHPLNDEQLHSFSTVTRMLPDLPASLANSAGVFLGEHYHFDMVRIGIGLYGGQPPGLAANPLRPIVRLRAQILQERDVPAGSSVGYEALYKTGVDRRIATIAAGYADGFPTGLSNSSHVVIGGQRVPVVGRVSMDLMTVDVTDVPLHLSSPGNWAELIGPEMSIEAVASAGNMIPYELLTGLGQRYSRVYIDE